MSLRAPAGGDLAPVRPEPAASSSSRSGPGVRRGTDEEVEGVATLMHSVLGVGLLGLPFVYRVCGTVLGTVLVLTVATVVAAGMNALLDAYDSILDRSGTSPERPLRQLSTSAGDGVVVASKTAGTSAATASSGGSVSDGGSGGSSGSAAVAGSLGSSAPPAERSGTALALLSSSVAPPRVPSIWDVLRSLHLRSASSAPHANLASSSVRMPRPATAPFPTALPRDDVDALAEACVRSRTRRDSDASADGFALLRTESGRPVPTSYDEVAAIAAGPAAGTAVRAGTTVLSVCSLVAYLNILADAASPVAGSVVPPGAEGARAKLLAVAAVAAGLAALVAMAHPRSARSLARFALGSLAAFALTTVVVAFLPHDFGAKAVSAAPRRLRIWRPAGLPIAAPVVVYSFTAHQQLFPVYAHLRGVLHGGTARDIARARGVVRRSVALATATYVAVGLAGYFAYGQNTSGDVLRNLGGGRLHRPRRIFERSLRAAYALCVLGGIPLTVAPLAGNLLAAFRPSGTSAPRVTKRARAPVPSVGSDLALCIEVDPPKRVSSSLCPSPGVAGVVARRPAAAAVDATESLAVQTRQGAASPSRSPSATSAPAPWNASLTAVCGSSGPNSSSGSPVRDADGVAFAMGHSRDPVAARSFGSRLHAALGRVLSRRASSIARSSKLHRSSSAPLPWRLLSGSSAGVHPSAARDLAAVLLVLVLAWAAAVAMPNVEYVFGLAGSTAASLIAFCMPAAIALWLARVEGAGLQPAASGGKGSAGACALDASRHHGIPTRRWRPLRRRLLAVVLFGCGLATAITCSRALVLQLRAEARVVALARSLARAEVRVAAASAAELSAARATDALQAVRSATNDLEEAKNNMTLAIAGLSYARSRGANADGQRHAATAVLEALDRADLARGGAVVDAAAASIRHAALVLELSAMRLGSSRGIEAEARTKAGSGGLVVLNPSMREMLRLSAEDGVKTEEKPSNTANGTNLMEAVRGAFAYMRPSVAPPPPVATAFSRAAAAMERASGVIIEALRSASANVVRDADVPKARSAIAKAVEEAVPGAATNSAPDNLEEALFLVADESLRSLRAMLRAQRAFSVLRVSARSRAPGDVVRLVRQALAVSEVGMARVHATSSLLAALEVEHRSELAAALGALDEGSRASAAANATAAAVEVDGTGDASAGHGEIGGGAGAKGDVGDQGAASTKDKERSETESIGAILHGGADGVLEGVDVDAARGAAQAAAAEIVRDARSEANQTLSRATEQNAYDVARAVEIAAQLAAREADDSRGHKQRSHRAEEASTRGIKSTERNLASAQRSPQVNGGRKASIPE